MSRLRSWVLCATFLLLAVCLLLGLYVGRADCAIVAEPPECTQPEEVVALMLGIGGYTALAIGVIFLIRSVWLEITSRTFVERSTLPPSP